MVLMMPLFARWRRELDEDSADEENGAIYAVAAPYLHAYELYVNKLAEISSLRQ
jgi:hypothetical protein